MVVLEVLTHHVRHAHGETWHHAVLHGHHRIETIHAIGVEIHVAKALLVLVEAQALLRICLSGVLLLLGLSIVTRAVLLSIGLIHLGFRSFGDDFHVALIARVFIINAFFGLVLLGRLSVALYIR
jgi:hypothetical protein